LYMTDLWLGSATVSRSTDRGATWQANPLQGVVVQDRQWVASAGGGNVYHATHQIPAGLVVSTSTAPNDGLVYPVSTVAATPADPVVASAGNGSLHAVWLEVFGTKSSRIRYARSADWGASWTKPATLVSAGTSVYPWVAAGGSKVSVTAYHTTAAGTPDTVAEGSQWFETYLESTDGGATFGPLAVIDSVPVKSGPMCTQGTGCRAGRQLPDV